ncbi:MAG TPA: acyltransferase family protein [Steroidobacteraceae bacterium]|jgi:peptidoglycan/LPS O-acetylase OafA/YrhL
MSADNKLSPLLDSRYQSRHTSGAAYRSDVDGLRALAVLAVIVYHANAHWLPGGFAGVDIFFVISGYLISGLIAKEIDRGSFRFANFYKRRIKRILPVYAVVCVAVTAISLYLLNVNDLIYFSASLAASWGFASNVFFSLLSGGYFDARFALFPLLHTWSLGVEEQFYFAFPMLLALTMRYQRRRLLPIVLIATVGFVLLSQAHATDPSAYYLLQFRAHELLLGVIAMLASRDFPLRSVACATILFVTGLAVTVASLFLIDPTLGFPGFQSLLPCLGAGLVIYAGAKANAVRVLLTNRPIVLVGLMSYSLYLWHWPILAFLRYRGITLDTGVIAGAVAVTFALSYLSWRLVELPVRENTAVEFKAAALRYYVLPAVVFIAFAAYAYSSHGIPLRFSPDLRALMSSYSRETDLSRACSTRPLDEPAVTLAGLAASCTLGATGQPKAQILLFGDSHANHVEPFLDIVARAANLAGVFHIMGGCPPTVRSDSVPTVESFTPSCVRHNRQLLDLAGNFRFVVLGGQWSSAGAKFEQDLQAAVAQIVRAGATPVVFRDVPASATDLSLCVLRKARGWLAASTRCEIPAAVARAQQAPFNLQIDQVAAKYPGMIVIDLARVLCDADHCNGRIDNAAVYRDTNHLNETASRMLAREYLSAVGNPFSR